MATQILQLLLLSATLSAQATRAEADLHARIKSLAHRVDFTKFVQIQRIYDANWRPALLLTPINLDRSEKRRHFYVTMPLTGPLGTEERETSSLGHPKLSAAEVEQSRAATAILLTMSDGLVKSFRPFSLRAHKVKDGYSVLSYNIPPVPDGEIWYSLNRDYKVIASGGSDIWINP